MAKHKLTLPQDGDSREEVARCDLCGCKVIKTTKYFGNLPSQRQEISYRSVPVTPPTEQEAKKESEL